MTPGKPARSPRNGQVIANDFTWFRYHELQGAVASHLYLEHMREVRTDLSTSRLSATGARAGGQDSCPPQDSTVVHRVADSTAYADLATYRSTSSGWSTAVSVGTHEHLTIISLPTRL